MSAVRLIDSTPEAREADPGENAVAQGPSDIYRTHFSFVWRNLYRLGVAEGLVEDAAQDVFLIVHRRWHTYEAKRSSLEVWLFGILIRVASNYRRNTRRRLAWLLPWRDRKGDEPAVIGVNSLVADLEQRSSLALLDRILNGLDEKKRVILLLVDVEELTVPEAAQVLKINLNTADLRLRTARQSFRQLVIRAQAQERQPQKGNRP